MTIDVVTLFPQMLSGFLNESIMKRATESGRVIFRAVNPRDFTEDRHRTVDDKPYGGGPGMVMMPDPLVKAVESILDPGARVVLLTPQGRQFRQDTASDLALCGHLIIVCGHYEGIDERVRLTLCADEISIGDYVLTNGTVAAAVVIDAVARLVPGVVGGEGAVENDSFSHGLLEYPQYTRPAVFRGMEAPEVLRGGNHELIARWRAEQAMSRTRSRRPDLLKSNNDGDNGNDS
ncbi:MAG: tRNA (guanosine(37)-N1)-methyltransferase TrmD [Lentisphaerales bacterium]|nr:MAG: tRNA (guanosine(37)-N1)-methyltransferase TrmD [Lentisphaerales bacterium]